MPKVAIYSQVYNMKNVMVECLESVQRQTISDYVHYVFDNGSTDGSWEIVQRYAAEDERVIARRFPGNKPGTINIGLEEICASDAEFYVGVDADDWIEANYLETCLSMFEKYRDIDIVIGGARYHQSAGDGEVYLRGWAHPEALLDTEMLGTHFPELFPLLRTHWAKMTRLSLIREFGLRYPRVRYGADTLFIFECVSHSRNLAVTPVSIYNYRLNIINTTNRFFPGRLDNDWLLYSSVRDYLEEIGQLSSRNLHFLETVLLHAVWDSLRGMLFNILLGESAADDLQLVLMNKIFIDITRKAQKDVIGGDFSAILMRYHPQLVTVLKKLDKKKRMRVAYMLICAFYPDAADYWDEADGKRFFTGDEQIASFEIGLHNRAWDTIQYTDPEEPIRREFKAFLAAQRSKPVAHRLSLDFLTAKQQRYVVDHLAVFSDLEDRALLLRVPLFTQLVWQGNYERALEILPELVVEQANSDIEAAYMLVRAGLVLSALKTEAGIYLFCLKAEAEILVGLEERELFWQKWEELDSLLPGDPEVEILKKLAEETL